MHRDLADRCGKLFRCAGSLRDAFGGELGRVPHADHFPRGLVHALRHVQRGLGHLLLDDPDLFGLLQAALQPKSLVEAIGAPCGDRARLRAHRRRVRLHRRNRRTQRSLPRQNAAHDIIPVVRQANPQRGEPLPCQPPARPGSADQGERRGGSDDGPQASQVDHNAADCGRHEGWTDDQGR